MQWHWHENRLFRVVAVIGDKFQHCLNVSQNIEACFILQLVDYRTAGALSQKKSLTLTEERRELTTMRAVLRACQHS